jgi:hypothetical protein
MLDAATPQFRLQSLPLRHKIENLGRTLIGLFAITFSRRDAAPDRAIMVLRFPARIETNPILRRFVQIMSRWCDVHHTSRVDDRLCQELTE